jgi:hypothetical protein
MYQNLASCRARAKLGLFRPRFNTFFKENLGSTDYADMTDPLNRCSTRFEDNWFHTGKTENPPRATRVDVGRTVRFFVDRMWSIT